jgi:hypothetical protein
MASLVALFVAACTAFSGSDGSSPAPGSDGGLSSAADGAVGPDIEAGGMLDGGPLPSGLVAHYKLDGDANDAVGGKNGTPKNVGWVPGVSGQAASCDGSSEIDLGDNLGFAQKSFSVLAWVNVNGTDAGHRFNTFVSKGVDWTNPTDSMAKGYGLGFRTDDRALIGATADGTTHQAAVQAGTLDVGAFRLVGMVVNRETPRIHIYIDGLHAADSPVSGGGLGSTASAYICQWSGQTTHGLIGSIDEVMFFDHALSGAEVAAVKSHFGK